jgi:uncharacterized protein (TIGR02284 family)
MSNNNNETTTVVNELIEAHNEREAGYRKAVDLVENSEAREIFNRYAAQSARFAAELLPYSDEKSTEEVGKGPLSALFRGWASIKATVTGHDTKAIYAWAETGEDTAIKIFEDAIKTGIPSEIQTLVQKQFSEIKEAHGHIKALRDA